MNRTFLKWAGGKNWFVDKLGESLVVSATSSDGVIEAIECSDDTFIIAFQGHIEKCLNNYDAYGKVVKRFIEESKNG